MKPDLSALEAKRNAQASAWMERGLELLVAGGPDEWRAAIGCFETAIALRQSLPFPEEPARRYEMAAGWINRGDAFARLGGAENLAAGLDSYARAIAGLGEPPSDDDGRFGIRLAIAWMSRGIALEQRTPEPTEEVVGSFRRAVELLERLGAAGRKAPALALAGARVNLAGALARSPDAVSAEAARMTARAALASLDGEEKSSLAAAEAGLKARHILCQALAVALDHGGDMDLVCEATDAVEGGLGLVQHWERAGSSRWRALAARIIEAGALLYERYQPHFLPEFLLEHLDPARPTCFLPLDAELLFQAREALRRARERGRNFDFESLATEAGKRRLEDLKKNLEAEARFEALRAEAARA